MLVFGFAADGDDPAVGTGAGGLDVEDFALDVKEIAGARGAGPSEFPPCSDESAGDGEATIDEEAHGDGGCVPAAGDLFAKKGCLRGLGIEVKGLRVELLSEGADLVEFHAVGSALETLADVEVFEVKFFGFVHGRFFCGEVGSTNQGIK